MGTLTLSPYSLPQLLRKLLLPGIGLIIINMHVAEEILVFVTQPLLLSLQILRQQKVSELTILL